MSEPVSERGVEEHAPVPTQSAAQVWIACAAFILVPTLLILLVKYFFGL